MAATQTLQVRITRWRGGQHPTFPLIKQILENEGMRPFLWKHEANYRYGVRSNGYAKTIYCVEGSIEIYLPDNRQTIMLRPGDRIDIGARVRHSITVGLYGTACLEGIPARQPR